MILKPVTPDSIDRVIELGPDWAQATDSEFDIESWRASVRNYAVYFDHMARVIINPVGETVGFVMAAVRQIPHTGQRRAHVHYIYVDSRYHESATMIAIIAEIRSWAEQFQIDRIEIVPTTGWPEWYLQELAALGFVPDLQTLIKGIA